MKHATWILLAAASVAHAGPNAKPPHGATTISIDYTWHSFTSDERHYKLSWDGTRYVSTKNKPVDGKLVDALYAALAATREVPEDLGCISHTDDYPAFKIAIEGDEPLTIVSQSNCHAYVPWNVHRGGKILAQFTGDAWRGLAPILGALDGTWRGNAPVATMTTGGEMVGLGVFSTIERESTGDAEACARSFDANPEARQLFGSAIHVTELDLGCDLGASADCTAVAARAEFEYAGLNMQIDFACKNGVASIAPAEVAAYRELAAFVNSRPVRALVKVSTTDPRPRLYENGPWSIDSGTLGVPMLEWKRGSTTIDARDIDGGAPNAAFWKELGINPRPLIRQRDGYAELLAKLDFSGKLVR